MSTPLQTRFAALPARPIEDGLVLRRGDMADYALLAGHHYKARRPATAARVLVLEHRGPTLQDRWRRPGGKAEMEGKAEVGRRKSEVRAEGCEGAPTRLSDTSAFRLPASAFPPVVAVLVESRPALCCRMRDWATGGRYAGLAVRDRAVLINAEVRVISRVIVHPQWRGLGLAVRLVRAALDSATTPYTEALAAMGRVSPFFTRAGMTAYPRPTHEWDARLIAALQCCGLSPLDLAMLGSTTACIQALPVPRREFLVRELTRWHRRNGGRRESGVRDQESGVRSQASPAVPPAGVRSAPTSKPHSAEPEPRRVEAAGLGAIRGAGLDATMFEQLLRAAQERLLCEPIYYLHANANSNTSPTPEARP